MAKAIEAVREKKMGYFKASKEFQVSRASRFHFVNIMEKNTNVAASTNLGRKSVLLKELEDEFQTYLVEIESMFFEAHKKGCLQSCYQLAAQNNTRHPFKDETADKDWFQKFIKRNSNFSI
ncbi:hypothetical protein NPIL_320341 [Nephila pilipes]|uniref:HTH psq-type domain-containing protein n=1 Tax=Nephila pilipes TaxID=299642 RepID=A0A8X6SZ63_NEPPI|nr:hypothetical protein NPIL_320341 [Nephila pilipes]